jgi:thiol-disulfide isomerase/thioredoxin
MINYMEPQPNLYIGGTKIINLDVDDFKVVNGKVYLREGRLNNLLSDGGYIQFYAPWCGHCRKYVPVYKSLADIVTTNTGNILFLGAFNSTQPGSSTLLENLAITGFPTIKYFNIVGGGKSKSSGGKKKTGGAGAVAGYKEINMVDYTGSREISPLLKYACDHGKVCISKK